MRKVQKVEKMFLFFKKNFQARRSEEIRKRALQNKKTAVKEHFTRVSKQVNNFFTKNLFNINNNQKIPGCGECTYFAMRSF